jgi:hypothetical protein
LIQLVMRQRFAMLDGFDPSEAPRVLWTRELHDPNLSPVAQLRSEIAMTGLVTDDYVFYQVGPALCCADIVTGDLLWERRNIPFTYVLHGDNEDLVAVTREPNDPTVAVFSSPTGAVISSGTLTFPAPLAGEWRGRRVLAAAVQPPHFSLAMIDVASRKTIWTKNYALPMSLPLIEEDEFTLVNSDMVLSVNSFESGNPIFTMPIEGGGRAPQMLIKRSGNRYFLLSQGSVVHIGPPTREALREAAIGKLWIVDRTTRKGVHSDALPLPQSFVDSPDDCPVIVLVRRPTRLEALRSNGGEVVLTILDARTARTLYEGQENTAAERISVHVDPEAHKVIITTDRSRLDITPAPGS